MSTPYVLPDGLTAWYWPKCGWTRDVSRLAADLVAHGITGVIPQCGLDAPAWCERNARVLESAGLVVIPGLGMDGTHPDHALADAIVRSFDVCGRAMLDWEQPKLWEPPSGNALAASIVDEVLQRRPSAAGCITDCPWWAPLTLGGHDTHPHAPTAIVGRLCTRDRYVQAYGALYGEGASLRYLAHARSASEYPRLGNWTIRGAFQMYRRSEADHLATLFAEPTQALWDWLEADDACKRALRAYAALRAAGYADVAAFQLAHSLTADGIVGPKTAAAMLAFSPLRPAA